MSRQLKELNDMLAEKENLMNECVSSEQKQESIKKQQQFEKKVRPCIKTDYSYCGTRFDSDGLTAVKIATKNRR